MKRLLLPLLLIIVVLVGLAPVGFGFWSDSRLNSMLDDLSQSGDVDFTVLKLERGWFSSTALVSAELSGNAGKAYLEWMRKKNGKAEIPGVILKTTIHHGPIPISSFSSDSFTLMPVVGIADAELREGVDEDAAPIINLPYTLQARMKFSGVNDVRLDIPEWNGPVGERGANMEWKGMKGRVSFGSGLSNLDMDIKAPSLNITDNTGRFTMKNVVLESETEKGIEGLALGDLMFQIESIMFQDMSNKTAFDLQKAVVKASSTASGDNVNSEMSMNIAKLKVGEENYGPASYTLSLRNLDAAAMARIQKQMQEIQKKNLPPDQVGMMMGATLFGEMANLLKKGPILEITQLDVKTPYGDITGSGKLTVDTSRPEYLSNPLLLKDAIIGELALRVPEEVLVAIQRARVRKELSAANVQYEKDQIDSIARNRVRRQMDGLVTANIFVREGDVYKLEARLEKGTPVVNGQVLQIPMGGGRKH